MTKTRWIAALAALATLGACATATPYQAVGDGSRGYSNQKIEANRWQITFSGNSLTDRQTVENYLLYRAAELTLQEGFDHFQIVRRDTEANRKLVSTGMDYYDPFFFDYRFYGRHGRLAGYPYGFWHPYHTGFSSRRYYHDPFWRGTYDFREVVRYEASTEIIMAHGDKPEDPAFFDARDVQANLASQIIRPEPK